MKIIFLLSTLIAAVFLLTNNYSASYSTAKRNTFFIAVEEIPKQLSPNVAQYDRYYLLSHTIRRPLFRWGSIGLTSKYLSEFSLNKYKTELRLCPKNNIRWCGKHLFTPSKLAKGIQNLVDQGSLPEAIVNTKAKCVRINFTSPQPQIYSLLFTLSKAPYEHLGGHACGISPYHVTQRTDSKIIMQLIDAEKDASYKRIEVRPADWYTKTKIVPHEINYLKENVKEHFAKLPNFFSSVPDWNSNSTYAFFNHRNAETRKVLQACFSREFFLDLYSPLLAQYQFSIQPSFLPAALGGRPLKSIFKTDCSNLRNLGRIKFLNFYPEVAAKLEELLQTYKSLYGLKYSHSTIDHTNIQGGLAEVSKLHNVFVMGISSNKWHDYYSMFLSEDPTRRFLDVDRLLVQIFNKLLEGMAAGHQFLEKLHDLGAGLVSSGYATPLFSVHRKFYLHHELKEKHDSSVESPYYDIEAF